MVRWIIASSLQLRILVIVIAASLIAIGVFQLGKAPVDVLPEFSPPYVEIQTESLGLSAEGVEQLITVPMEQDLLNGLPWLDAIRSESLPGLSSIVLMFKRGTDLMRARQMVSERLTQAVALPHVSKPPIMLQPLSATSRVMIVGLASQSLSPIQLSVLARWTIAPRLMGVPGVANVAIWGQRDRELQVQVDPRRLQDQNVSLLRVLETTGNALWVSSLSFVEASTPGTGGFIDTSNQRLGIRHILPIVSPEDLAQVPIEDTTLRLGDVADVVEDHQPLIGDALTHDGPSLLLVVEKFPRAHTLEVTRGVEAALAELLPGLPGVQVNPNIFRPADFIETAIHNLTLAGLIGFLFVALVLAASFFGWRTALISLLAIPLSLVTAGLVLYATGATINMIVVTGFVAALGIVIYHAIVEVENIMQRLRRYRQEQPTRSKARIILEASHEASGAIVYAALVVLLTVAPVLFLGGMSGAFYRPLAVSYGLAVLASLAVALTVTPALCLLLLTNASLERPEPRLVRWLQRAYETVLGRVLQRKLLAFFAVGALSLMALGIRPFLSQSLLPSFKELSLVIHLNSVPGTSQPAMSRISSRVSRELKSIPGVRNVAAHIGRAVRGDQVVNVNSAELWVNIDPAANYDKTASAIQEVVEGYPGLNYQVQTYLREKSGDVVAEPEDDIVVRVFGDTYPVLKSKAEDIARTISEVQGVVESKIKLPVQQATLETEVDLAAAQRHGLKPGDVRRAAATLLSGIVVGSLFEDQKVFDVVVWSTPETRHSLSSIRDLMLDVPGGGHVRLGDVAKVRIVPSASVIRHDAVKRYIDVVADVRGRDLHAVAADISGRLKQIRFPLEYHAEVLGEYAVPQAARTRLLALGLAAAAGVFFLLQAAFGSWWLATLCFLTLPAALAGGLLVALATSGGVISLGSLAGLLAVFGVAVCSSVTLFRHYQQLAAIPEVSPIDPEVTEFRAHFAEPSRLSQPLPHDGTGIGPPMVLRGARERLGPILTTMSATGLGLLPFVFLGDLPGFEIVRPMALVTLGGLVTSTLFVLFGVPVMFLLFGHRRGTDLDDLDILPSHEEIREAVWRAPGLGEDVQSTSMSD